MPDRQIGPFRVVAEVSLEEPQVFEPEENEEESKVTTYFQTFGITTDTHSRAALLAEEALQELVDDDPDGRGWLEELTVRMMIFEDIDPEAKLLQDPQLEGVHFISGRIFCSGDYDDDE